MRMIAKHAKQESIYKFFDMDLIELNDGKSVIMISWGQTTLDSDGTDFVIQKPKPAIGPGPHEEIIKAFQEKVAQRREMGYEIYDEKNQDK